MVKFGTTHLAKVYILLYLYNNSCQGAVKTQNQNNFLRACEPKASTFLNYHNLGKVKNSVLVLCKKNLQNLERTAGFEPTYSRWERKRCHLICIAYSSILYTRNL